MSERVIIQVIIWKQLTKGPDLYISTDSMSGFLPNVWWSPLSHLYQHDSSHNLVTFSTRTTVCVKATLRSYTITTGTSYRDTLSQTKPSPLVQRFVSWSGTGCPRVFENTRSQKVYPSIWVGNYFSTRFSWIKSRVVNTPWIISRIVDSLTDFIITLAYLWRLLGFTPTPTPWWPRE